VTRHGTPDPQIAALLRSPVSLAPNASNGLRHSLDRRRRPPISGNAHPQTRVRTRSERMIAPPSPTAPASPKP